MPKLASERASGYQGEVQEVGELGFDVGTLARVVGIVPSPIASARAVRREGRGIVL